MSKVSVVIPAFNEERYLEKTIHAVRTLPFELEVIVVNDGSQDGTGMLAEKLAEHAIHFSKNQGKGKALQAAWRQVEGEYILCLDADLQESAAEAIHLLQPLFEEKADVIISKVKPGAKSGFGFIKRRAQSIVYKKTGIRLEAPLSGQRAFHRQLLPILLRGRYEGFGVETQMSIDILKANATILEVETNMKHREMGKTVTGFRHRFKQWLEIERNCREVGPS
ncbi:glycosyltransferase family 2 protein [Halalkalibacter urbisdiaboli]|uniref:glycosyltransferase family 2 protein n=1 Tax=Halalkalibacter urbisdiaboli TaxID=1960589 RepID=UPI000B43B90D|nr:glycosyltransferase family 2 protein [Halalkalibacter urbisdiaboli]